MPHALAQAVELVTTVLTVAGMGYFFAALLAAFVFLGKRRAAEGFAPGVTILKSLKGLDPAMLDAFRSHCRQDYAGEYELLFGVSSAEDPAAAAVAELQKEFPERAIRLVVCPERLGTNGKVSTLAQLIPHARFEYLLINDSDITVSARYLSRVMGKFQGQGTSDKGQKPVGLVTALYRGRPHGSLWSKLEALGIATDFQPSVLLARWIEGGLRYGLGSTLAVSREALAAIGGIETLVDHLADDYELGARIYKAGYAIALSREVVETSVPDYNRRGFFDHQMRWYRTVRDARPGGYVGLVFTLGLGWALLNVVASGASLLSVWLLAMSFFLRLALAMAVAANVLGDHYVLPNLWLLPLRDVIAMGTWVAGFAGNTIVWRGERFEVKDGKLSAADRS
ncbi:bacteriohopanetetrol glucosamine biosynthesis glycosyltransferase HpnI [Occallatibacter riparius]|uniref:Bacteriohopanetetrol glucosamine biosynthesis glycosyltransferase HpnI n=1 Tax=Occallatibacter riparius TaxID=1002689 RepID=A0A9J7BTM2_9BACT|nr:bacteriohopanetetrol glucosamine biosynthesis glycosyltransferase HpnI [Occallatibacter riparius]UWZ85983.1 bacteriohopanetetrol glucosamine biosynthesis glycosyltransferase HpnI [Occallatibacter riparius]